MKHVQTDTSSHAYYLRRRNPFAFIRISLKEQKLFALAEKQTASFITSDDFSLVTAAICLVTYLVSGL